MRNDNRTRHSSPPGYPSGPAARAKLGVASEGMSSENAKREVWSAYAEACSACRRWMGGWRVGPVDGGCRFSGIISWDSRNAQNCDQLPAFECICGSL